MTGSSGDEAAGRVRDWLTRDMVNRPARDRLCASYEQSPLNRSDLRALLDEREQLREAVKLEREAYDRQGAQVHQVRSELHDAWKDRDAATARTEQAEAESHRRFIQLCRVVGIVEHAYSLNSYVQLEPGETPPTIADIHAQVHEVMDGAEQRQDSIEIESVRENQCLREANLIDADMRLLLADRDSWRMLADSANARASRAEAELAKHKPGPVLRAWHKPDGRYVHGEADWIRESIDAHGGEHVIRNTCGYDSPWRSADGQPQDGRRQPWEPIRTEADLAELSAAPEDRLSDEEYARFQADIASCRGGEQHRQDEEGSGDG